jgi:hypothetical protein
LIDFEKAFDTVEWSYIENTLQFYGFGQSLQKWIKAFYCDISSAVTSNGHVSEFSHWGEVSDKRPSVHRVARHIWGHGFVKVGDTDLKRQFQVSWCEIINYSIITII